MDREAWHAVIHVVAKSQTPLSDWTELKSRSGLASSSGMSVFSVLRNFHTLFLVAVPTQLQSCPQYRRILCFPRPQQQLTFVGRRWFLCRPFGRWIFCEVWGDTSLQFWLDFSKSDPENLFMCFMAIWMPSLETHPFRSLRFFYWIDRGVFCFVLFCFAALSWAAWAVCMLGDEFVILNICCKHLFSHSDSCLFLSFRLPLQCKSF